MGENSVDDEGGDLGHRLLRVVECRRWKSFRTKKNIKQIGYWNIIGEQEGDRYRVGRSLKYQSVKEKNMKFDGLEWRRKSQGQQRVDVVEFLKWEECFGVSFRLGVVRLMRGNKRNIFCIENEDGEDEKIGQRVLFLGKREECKGILWWESGNSRDAGEAKFEEAGEGDIDIWKLQSMVDESVLEWK